MDPWVSTLGWERECDAGPLGIIIRDGEEARKASTPALSSSRVGSGISRSKRSPQKTTTRDDEKTSAWRMVDSISGLSWPIQLTCDCALSDQSSQIPQKTAEDFGSRMLFQSFMPQELLVLALSRLIPKDLAALGAVSRSMRELERHFAAGDSLLLLAPSPMSPSEDELLAAKLWNCLDISSWPLIVKNSRPGLGTFVGAEPIGAYNTLFEVEVVHMGGVGIDIGLAPAAAFKSGYLAKDEAWLFDCWGRARHGPTPVSYGAKVRPGDRVGVLYNAADDTLSFLLNGVSMGVAFTQVVSSSRRHSGPSLSDQHDLLYPIINLPFVTGEAVRISRGPLGLGGVRPSSVAVIERSAERWVPPPHPDDFKLIVETLSKEAFRIELPRPSAETTVLEIKQRLAENFPGCGPEQILIEVGGRFRDDKCTLKEAGIVFDDNGNHLAKVYMHLENVFIA